MSDSILGMSKLDQVCAAVEYWQRQLVDQTFTEKVNDHRIKNQIKLIEPQLNGTASQRAEAIHNSIHSICAERLNIQNYIQILNELPTLTQKITRDELRNSQWSTDKTIHFALQNTGLIRSRAADFRYWQLLTTKLIENKLLPDERWMIQLSSSAPHLSDLINQQPDQIRKVPGAVKALDKAVRELFRNLGGIYHRPSNLRLDAPLVRAWWRVEVCTQLTERSGENGAKFAYNQLFGKQGARKWMELAAGSAPRLAVSTCVAGLAMAAAENPTIRLTTLTKTLLRRTENLHVDMVDPETLAAIAVP